MARSDSGTELLKGTIPLMALRVIGEGDCYGYDLIRRIEAASQGRFDFKEGTVYPILHALERDGSVESYWSEAAGRRRKYYRLTPQGRADLDARRVQWFDFVDAVAGVLGEGE